MQKRTKKELFLTRTKKMRLSSDGAMIRKLSLSNQRRAEKTNHSLVRKGVHIYELLKELETVALIFFHIHPMLRVKL